MTGFRVIALIAAYNEEDVIAQVLQDLIAQGVEVYLLDHCSTDGTVAEASAYLGQGLLRIERFPEESGFPATDEARFAWTHLLERKEQLAQTLDAHWFIHHDADELRESPWDGVGLANGLSRVDALGYNAVDFKALDFLPTHDDFRKGDDLRAAFPRFRPAAVYDRLRINAWKRQTGGIDLRSRGGHEVNFPGRRVFPVRFLLRHYPLRGQAHAERKVQQERLPRYPAEERAKGWHIQYDGIDAGGSFLVRPEDLSPFDAGLERARLLEEHREVELYRTQPGNLSVEEADLAWFRATWPRREQELVDATSALEATTAELGRVRQNVAALQTRLDDGREERVTSLLDQCAQLEHQVKSLHAQVEELLRSMSWKTTAPLRFVLRQLRGF